MTTEEMFDAASDEYLDFDHIPEADRRHPVPDICALIYLHEKLGARRAKGGPNTFCDAIGGAEHDIIYLDFEKLKRLTPEDAVYLQRCGVSYDEEQDLLSKFV